MDEHKTLRLLMFEVWEEGQHFPLFITSDGTEARRELHEGDTLVKRWWVREGPLAAVGAHRDALADGSVDDPESRSLVPADQERNEQ